MLHPSDTALVLIDVQGKLAQAMHGKEQLFANLEKLLQGGIALNVPVLWVEQVPEKMGESLPELRRLLLPRVPIRKVSFSCCGCDDFMAHLNSLSVKNIVLCGIETHVCVYQTALDLVRMAFHTEVVSDATSARHEEDKRVALVRIQHAGGHLTTVEMVLFELLRSAEAPEFKDVQKIVR